MRSVFDSRLLVPAPVRAHMAFGELVIGLPYLKLDVRLDVEVFLVVHLLVWLLKSCHWSMEVWP